MNLCVSVKDMQFDNQLHSRGNYDFPVLLISEDVRPRQRLDMLNVPLRHCIEVAQKDPVIRIEMDVESWRDTVQLTNITGMFSTA